MATVYGQQDPGVGLALQTIEMTLTAHAAISKGDLVAVAPTVDTATYKFTTTQAPASGNTSIDDNEFGVFVVAMEDVALGALGRFAIQGVIDVSADGTAAIAVGNGVEADPTAANVNVATTAGSKVVGYALEALGSGTGLIKVLFDGLNGFGTVHA
jgi:predicted RecA/RadA family phage recombinase